MQRIISVPTADITIHVTKRKWDFPRERFVEYEPQDELWCRPLGIGREVDAMDTIEIPNAVLTQFNVDASGRITGAFQLSPNGAELFFNSCR